MVLRYAPVDQTLVPQTPHPPVAEEAEGARGRGRLRTRQAKLNQQHQYVPIQYHKQKHFGKIQVKSKHDER